MKRNSNYSTEQKDILLAVIKKQTGSFTVKDIFSAVSNVGLTTIYRFVDKLVSEDIIKKYIGENNITYYQYLGSCDEENHFYLKCDKCGFIEHVDCECIGEFASHIFKEHNFSFGDNTMISGICSNCLNK